MLYAITSPLSLGLFGSSHNNFTECLLGSRIDVRLWTFPWAAWKEKNFLIERKYNCYKFSEKPCFNTHMAVFHAQASTGIRSWQITCKHSIIWILWILLGKQLAEMCIAWLFSRSFATPHNNKLCLMLGAGQPGLSTWPPLKCGYSFNK